MKNCPTCNRTLVEGPDHSLKCIFCGWSAAAQVAQAEQEEEKMKQTAEEIARQRIKEDTSKAPQIIIAVIAVVGVLIFVLTTFVFKGEDKPEKVAPSAKPTPVATIAPSAPVQSESTEPSESVTEASAEPSLEPTPEATPSEETQASVEPSDTPDNSESASSDVEASPEASAEATTEPSPN